MSDEQDSGQWLSASEAFDLLDAAGLSDKAELVGTRAVAGVLKTRAEGVLRGSNVKPAGELPKEFWWAKGKPAMSIDWTSGDVETRGYDRTERALGVRFDRNGVLAILPANSTLSEDGRAVSMAESNGVRRSRYRDGDEALVREAHDLVASGKEESPWAACGRLAHRAKGVAGEDGKRKRLRAVYKEMFSE